MDRLQGHQSGVTSLAYHHSLLFSGSDDHTCRLWDPHNILSISTLRGYQNPIASVEFLSTHHLVVSEGPHLHIYDRRQPNQPLLTINHTDPSDEFQAVSTRGDFVAYTDDMGRVGVLDYTDDTEVNWFQQRHDGLAGCVSFHPTKPELASGGFDQQVLVWDLATEQVIQTYNHSRDPVDGQLVNPPYPYALTYIDDMLCSGHADGQLAMASENRIIGQPGCHGYSVTALDFVVDGTDCELLVTAGLDCFIKVWDSRSLFNSAQPPSSLAHIELDAKPDTLVAPSSSSIYSDQHNDIVSYILL